MSSVLGRATWKKRLTPNDPAPDPAHWSLSAASPEQKAAFDALQPAGMSTGTYLGKLPPNPTLPFASQQNSPGVVQEHTPEHSPKASPPGPVPAYPPTSQVYAESAWTPRNHRTLEDFRPTGEISHGEAFPPIGAAPPEETQDVMEKLIKYTSAHRLDVEQAFRQGGGPRTGSMHKARFMATVDLVFRKLGLTTAELVLLADQFGSGLPDPRFGGHIEVRWRDFVRSLEDRAA